MCNAYFKVRIEEAGASSVAFRPLLCNSYLSDAIFIMETKHDQCLHCVFKSSYSQVRFYFVSCVPGDCFHFYFFLYSMGVMHYTLIHQIFFEMRRQLLPAGDEQVDNRRYFSPSCLIWKEPHNTFSNYDLAEGIRRDFFPPQETNRPFVYW